MGAHRLCTYHGCGEWRRFRGLLAGATGNLIGNNNVNNNGFGIYSDGSCRDKLSNNSASNEEGGDGNASRSDGIYMFNSNANNVTHCKLSNEDNFGVSLCDSKNNAFSNKRSARTRNLACVFATGPTITSSRSTPSMQMLKTVC